MAGRKPVLINLRTTSPDGEVRYFRSITDAARELGFSDTAVRRTYRDNRPRIGQYELEWLDVDELEEEPVEKKSPKRRIRTSTAKARKVVEEAMTKAEEENIRERVVKKCTFCGEDLDGKDLSDFFILVELNDSGNAVSHNTYENLHRASQATEISQKAFRNARDKGNTVIVRRRDKTPFRIMWSNIHKRCFDAKKRMEKDQEREKELLEEAKRREALSKMSEEEFVEFKRKEEEERNRKDIEFNKLFDRLFLGK